MRLNDPDPFGYVISGSDHDALILDQDEKSPTLSDLVDCFLEQDYNCIDLTERETTTEYSSCDRVKPCLISKRVIDELLNNDASSSSDSYKRMLQSHVSQAIKALSRFRPRDKQTLNRNVMYFLRKLGHNAAICKSKWESSGGSLAAGHYDFIDVESNSIPQSRYFIDLNFAVEFEIARPTEYYSNLLNSILTVVATTEEVLKKVIKVVAEEAKRSLKSRDLHLRTWRKNRYMQMKWLGADNQSLSFRNAVTCNRFLGFEVKHVTADPNGRYTVRPR